LLPAGLLTDALSTGIARAFNIKNGRVVTSPSNNKVAISAASELDATHYIDPATQEVFLVDHLTLATTADRTANTRIDSTLEKKCAALNTALKSYLEHQYKPEDSAIGAYPMNGNIVVVLVSEKPNLRNYWSGRWASVWTIKAGSAFSISGEIKVHAHYFEDGNIQLNTTRPIDSSELPAGTDAEFANAVITFIENAETKTRAALDDMFATLNTDTLKSMRRVMPITRTKMEWNVNSVRMTRQVNQKK